MPRTVENLQTKGWEHMSIRLPKDVKENLRQDAKKEMRPIGLHASYIIQQYIKNKESKKL